MEELSQKSLKQLITYDRVSGKIRWRKRPKWKSRGVPYFQSEAQRTWWNDKYARKVVGPGQPFIKLLGRQWMKTHIIWVYEFDVMPEGRMRYKNDNQNDTRLINIGSECWGEEYHLWRLGKVSRENYQSMLS